MSTFKRITVRQGIIEQASNALASTYECKTLQVCQHNAQAFIWSAIFDRPARKAYYNALSPLGKKRLHNTIARSAYEQASAMRLFVKRPFSSGYVLSVDRPLHYTVSVKRF